MRRNRAYILALPLLLSACSFIGGGTLSPEEAAGLSGEETFGTVSGIPEPAGSVSIGAAPEDGEPGLSEKIFSSISSLVGASPGEDHISWTSCLIEGGEIVLTGVSDAGFGLGDDGSYYLLELAPYEDSAQDLAPVAAIPKGEEIRYSIPLDRSSDSDRLFDRFIACTLSGDHFEPVSDYIYVTNPEAVSKVTRSYQEPLSKKGLLIEVSEISDAFSLGVCNVIINIPFDTLFGEGIDYEYDSETYHFDRDVVAVYDRTISMFSNKSMNVHVILLNRYNPSTPDLFYPGITGDEGAQYYGFNASTSEGYKDIRAVASFLASRYSGTDPDHGLVQNWIIGNEINNQAWNYIGPMELSDYVREYARAFRVFYSAIKSEFASARVYFSLDNNWCQGDDGELCFGARDTLAALSEELASHGNIDWGLGYHPYPVPTVEPEFWDDFETGLVTDSEDSPVVNFANLSVLTDFMAGEELRDSLGEVRSIVLSEQGFTSLSYTRGSVEELQAAAFAYAYYIADSNPYIDAFILSRQVDAPSERAQSLAFGLWTTDATEDVAIRPLRKKYIWDVFKHIDKQATTLEYSSFALDILGAEKWSDLIEDFRWRKLEN